MAAPAGGAPAAAASPFVTVRTDPASGIAVLTMAKEPVNSMDYAMWAGLDSALSSLEADPSVKAVVFSSGLKRDVFSAGNDLLELYAPKTSEERYAKFWIAQNAFLVRLHRSRLVTVAAIRGACPAGGCAISLCSDFRIITPDGTMGLNEVQLGIPVPKFWGLLMGRVLGSGRLAESILLTGRMVKADEAKQLGLVDEIVDRAALVDRAVAVAAEALKQPAEARASTKGLLREDFCRAWEQYYPNEPEWAWQMLTSPITMKVLEGAMARLSSKGPGAGAKPTQPQSKL
ncbi:hypothetical protein HYH03_013520 [Edaphochlamys debaryana]|uniref:Uncharacterized protein n=1 Tax=Edaphochlamys debaryana TaxID=47281 RepID=A0A835XTH3_9CHLO|nr:hypothetical protein HYH03_013520 [Edaphochlamys debaryana]|eukprot:KAG2487941.1 hypothetical protein HYH03_013520 [Edaphochlamys debaryana]